jgi:hypothetical protein
MARSYKRDAKGRFAASRSTKVKRAIPTKVVRGSIRRNVRVGKVGPGGSYTGVKAGAELRPRKGSTRYYVGVSAGVRIAGT